MNVLIVLNYNDGKTTAGMVGMALECEALSHIVVVDNCSTDDSFSVLSELASERVDVIRTDCNGGYASGNNFGAEYAMTKYSPDNLFIANPDVEFDGRTVEALSEYLSKNPKVGIVSCKMICTSGIDTRQAWRIPRYGDCIRENLILLKKITGNRTWYPESHFEGRESMVEAVSGSFFAISADAFKKVGGFDANTFLYYEENIIASKLLDAGYHNVILNDFSYVHRHSESINKSMTSVKRRLKTAYVSRKYFCRNYLRKRGLAMAFLALTFHVGLFNYLLALKIFKIKR